MPTEGTQVRISRTELLAPSLEDPTKIVFQISYQVGELPPRFIYIAKKEWTKEKEAAAIRADLDKRLKSPGETITI